MVFVHVTRGKGGEPFDPVAQREPSRSDGAPYCTLFRSSSPLAPSELPSGNETISYEDRDEPEPAHSQKAGLVRLNLPRCRSSRAL